MIRRVWVPVKTLVLVEVETDETDRKEVFLDAVEVAYCSDLHRLPTDGWELDEDEIRNPEPELLDEWVED